MKEREEDWHFAARFVDSITNNPSVDPKSLKLNSTVAEIVQRIYSTLRTDAHRCVTTPTLRIAGRG